MSDVNESASIRKPRWRGAWRCLLLAAVTLPFPWVRVSCVESRPDGKRVVGMSVSQTGIQAMYGGATLDQGNGNGPLGGLFPGANPMPARGLNGGGMQADSTPQPMMIVYVIALVVGIAGVWLFADRERPGLIQTASVTALVMIGIQSGLGLPLASKTARGAAPGGVIPMSIEVAYTPWFWVAIGATAASAVLAFVQFGSRSNPAPLAEKAPKDDWPGVA